MAKQMDLCPRIARFPVFSLTIREFDRGEQFASDCVIQQPITAKRLISVLREPTSNPLTGPLV
jgi:hypothetical protein